MRRWWGMEKQSSAFRGTLSGNRPRRIYWCHLLMTPILYRFIFAFLVDSLLLGPGHVLHLRKFYIFFLIHFLNSRRTAGLQVNDNRYLLLLRIIWYEATNGRRRYLISPNRAHFLVQVIAYNRKTPVNPACFRKPCDIMSPSDCNWNKYSEMIIKFH